MTTRIWKTYYLDQDVIPAMKAAGYLIENRPAGMTKVIDPDNGECHMRAMAKDEAGEFQIVTYDARLLDENAPREYPTGL
jgi:hypothetical protein